MYKWYFLPTSKGWEWHRVDANGKLSKSTRSFETRNACVADARRHGYSPPPLKRSLNRKLR